MKWARLDNKCFQLPSNKTPSLAKKEEKIICFDTFHQTRKA